MAPLASTQLVNLSRCSHQHTRVRAHKHTHLHAKSFQELSSFVKSRGKIHKVVGWPTVGVVGAARVAALYEEQMQALRAGAGLSLYGPINQPMEGRQCPYRRSSTPSPTRFGLFVDASCRKGHPSSWGSCDLSSYFAHVVFLKIVCFMA